MLSRYWLFVYWNHLNLLHLFLFILRMLTSRAVQVLLIWNQGVVFHELSLLENDFAVVLELILVVKTLAFRELGDVNLAN